MSSWKNDLDDVISNFSDIKLSALTRATDITKKAPSKYYRKVIYGPADDGNKSIIVTMTNIESNTKKKPSIKSRLGPKVPNNDVIDPQITENKMGHQHRANDKITIDMLRYEDEFLRKDIVRKELGHLKSRIVQSNHQLLSKLEASKNAATKKCTERVIQIEQKILKDLEQQQHEANLWQQKKDEEYEKQQRRMQEVTLKVKREQEIKNKNKKKQELLNAIFYYNKAFNSCHQEFIDTIRSLTNHELAQQVWNNSRNLLKDLTQRMADLINRCKNIEQTEEDVELASKTVEEVVNLYATAIQEYQNLEEKENVEKQRYEDAAKKQAEIVKEEQNKQLKAQRVQSTATANSEVNLPISGFDKGGTVAHWRIIAQYHTFLQDYVKQLEQLKNDDSLKKFRFDCKKAVNLPINAIAGVGASHLKDKLNKLEDLLSGKPVTAANVTLTSTQHPQGLAYCTDLIAHKLVKQGLIVASNPESAFPIATVIVSLWSKFPDLGTLILGYIYQYCPYLVPVCPPRDPEASEQDYYRSIGYEISAEGSIETKDSFLKHMCGIGQLYFAITITECKTADHPHGLTNAWSWLAAILNMSPLPDISASLILQCVEITGHNQLKYYKNEFTKMLKVLQHHYMPILEKIDEGGPKLRLQEFLTKTFKEGKIDPPKRTISVDPTHYW